MFFVKLEDELKNIQTMSFYPNTLKITRFAYNNFALLIEFAPIILGENDETYGDIGNNSLL